MNKCVNIVFILLYSETLFEERNVYVQICKIKNKLCFIYAGLFCSLFNQFLLQLSCMPDEAAHSNELPLSNELMKSL